jgi:hypothetical protein
LSRTSTQLTSSVLERSIDQPTWATIIRVTIGMCAQRAGPDDAKFLLDALAGIPMPTGAADHAARLSLLIDSSIEAQLPPRADWLEEAINLCSSLAADSFEVRDLTRAIRRAAAMGKQAR